MHMMYFSERPYHPVDEEILLKNGYWGVPNKYLDPAVDGGIGALSWRSASEPLRRDISSSAWSEMV